MLEIVNQLDGFDSRGNIKVSAHEPMPLHRHNLSVAMSHVVLIQEGPYSSFISVLCLDPLLDSVCSHFRVGQALQRADAVHRQPGGWSYRMDSALPPTLRCCPTCGCALHGMCRC